MLHFRECVFPRFENVFKKCVLKDVQVQLQQPNRSCFLGIAEMMTKTHEKITPALLF